MAIVSDRRYGVRNTDDHDTKQSEEFVSELVKKFDEAKQLEKINTLKKLAKMMGYPLCEEWDCAASGILIGKGDGDLREFDPENDFKQLFEVIEYFKFNIEHKHGGVEIWRPTHIGTSFGETIPEAVLNAVSDTND